MRVTESECDMKRSKTFFAIFLAVFGIWFFLSCASQSASSEDGEEKSADSEEAAAEESIADSSEDSLEDTTDKESEGKKEETAEKKDDALGGGDDLTELTEDTKKEEEKSEDSLLSEGEKTEEKADEKAKDELSELESLTADADKSATDEKTAAATTKLDESLATPPAPPSAEPPKIEVPSVVAVVPEAVEAPKDVTADSPERPAHPYAGAELPTIPATAITKGNASLNRFYFLRKGDTPASVAKLLYGNAVRAKDLREWNSGTWRPGKGVYYASPFQPDDTEMRSFYQERQVPADTYTVKRGEWLSKIATQKLGHPASWKEIAIVNGLSGANDIKRNKRLAIYPRNLKPYMFSTQEPAPIEAPPPTVAENALAPAPESKAPDSTLSAPAPEPASPETTAPTPAPDAVPHETSDAEKNQVTTEKKGLDFRKLLQQNLPAAFLIGGVLVLAGLLFFVNKRRKSSQEDTFDDNLAPPQRKA